MTSEQWREGRESGATDCPQTQTPSGEWREWRVLPTYCVSNFSSRRKEREIPIEGSTGRRATRATHVSRPCVSATPPGIEGGTPYGDQSMNNQPTVSKNLHPVWQRHFGIQTIQPTKPQAKPRNTGEALMRAVQKLAAAHPSIR